MMFYMMFDQWKNSSNCLNDIVFDDLDLIYTIISFKAFKFVNHIIAENYNMLPKRKPLRK